MKTPPPLRIIYVVQSLVKGGAERLILEICKEIKKRNIAEVIIVGFDNKNEYPELSKNISFLYVPIRYKLGVFKKNIIDVSAFEKIVAEFRPDIIHTNCYYQEAPAREVIHKNVGYFTHLHDNMPAFKRFYFIHILSKKRLADLYEKRRLIKMYKESKNTFLAISRDTCDFFKKSLPHSLAKRIVMFPNAINYEKFYNGNRRYIIPGKKIQLVNVGHFALKKNQSFLLRVLFLLCERNIDVNLKLIGDCEKVKSEFVLKAKTLGIDERLIMTGAVEDVERHLHEADIYVHSATYEPFGLVLLEAMASGLPVVCLDARGNRDILEDGKNGFILKNANEELFAQTIIRLIEDTNLYGKMSDYAKEYAKKYDVRDYVDRLFTIYSSG